MKQLWKRMHARGLAVTAAVLTLALAGPPAAQAGNITVESAVPSVADQGLTVDVAITGSGFAKGAKAYFYVTMTNDPGGVTVNSTTLVSPTRLTANITVSSLATIDKYDIEIKQSTRSGRGIELFKVDQKAPSMFRLTELLGDAVTGTNLEGLGDGHVAAGNSGVAKTYENTLNPSVICNTGHQAAAWDVTGVPPIVSPKYLDPGDIYTSAVNGSSSSGVYVAGDAFGGSADPTRCSWYYLPIVWEAAAGGWVRHALPHRFISATTVDVNDSGEVAGYEYDSGLGDWQALYWTKNTTGWDPPAALDNPLPGYRSAIPIAVNDWGLIAGNAFRIDSVSPANQPLAVYWQCGASGCSAVEPLPMGGYIYTDAQEVSEDGDIVGFAALGSGEVRAVLWRYEGGTWSDPLDLGAITGQTKAAAYGSRRLNGEPMPTVVGKSTTTSGDRGFRWREGTGMVDLNLLTVRVTGFTVTEGRSIDAGGAIGGSATRKIGKITNYRGCVLTP